MLDHEQRGIPPRRPRMCATCGRPREIVSFAKPDVLVCVECGTTSEDGRGWRAELAPDDEGDDAAEVPVYCPDCWQSEFGAAWRRYRIRTETPRKHLPHG